MKESEKIKAEIRNLELERSDINSRISDLQTRLAAVVSAESGFIVGDHVNVITDYKTERGIYGGTYTKFGEVRHSVKKIKKDGTASAFEIYTYGAKIEKA